MHHQDVKLALLTRNLLTLAEGAAAHSTNETKRYRKGVANARKAAEAAFQVADSAPVKTP